MTIKAKVFGAGSIGNHLTQACRRAGWEVCVVDNDANALNRMKEEIYPKRYGAWDDGIKLYKTGEDPKGGYDVILIGTPPDAHLKIGLHVLKEEAPKVLQMEKPLCSPTLEGLKEFLDELKKNPETKVVVGYDHIVAENTLKAEEILSSGVFKNVLSMDCEFRSHWKNIFDAHPWLSGPKDTYLGFWKRGGGAGGEHSHGLNLWQHFAHVLGAGRIKEVTALIDYVEDGGASYDRSCFLQVVTEKGLVGRVAQDVITNPKKKFLEMQFSNGSLKWDNDVTKTTDQITINEYGKEKQVLDISKTRQDEFYHEVMHIQKLLDGSLAIKDSPISLERAVDTMLVLAASHKSAKEKKTIQVEYSY